MAKLFKGTCRECGAEHTSPKAGKLFCSGPCRQTFNNRRLQRGAELYDAFMVIRNQRAIASDRKMWSVMCRMAEYFRDEDVAKRNGRQSWRSADELLADRPDLKSVRMSVKFKRKG